MAGPGPASNCQARQRGMLSLGCRLLLCSQMSEHSDSCHALPRGRGSVGYHPDPIELPSSGMPLTTPGLPHPLMWDSRPGTASIHLARHPSASIPGCKGNIYKSHFQTGYTFVQRSRWVGVAACHLRYLYSEEVWGVVGTLREGAERLEETFPGFSDLSKLRLLCPQC